MTRVRQLNNPQYTLLENIGKVVENIDFIYFATADSDQVSPQKGESKDLYWLSKEEIIDNPNIKEHIRIMALEALHTLEVAGNLVKQLPVLFYLRLSFMKQILYNYIKT